MHDVLVHYLEVNFAEIAEQLAQARAGAEPSSEQRAAAAERLRQLVRRLRQRALQAAPVRGRPPEEEHPAWQSTAGLAAAVGIDLEESERVVLDHFLSLFTSSMERTANRPAPAEPAVSPPPPAPMMASAPPSPSAAPAVAPPRAAVEPMPAAVQTILQATAQQALDLLQVDASYVYAVGEDRRFVLRAGVPVDSPIAPESNGTLTGGLLARALEQNEVLSVQDLAAESLTGDEQAWLQAGFRGLAAIALAPPLERPVGVLALFRRTPWRLDRGDAVHLEDLAQETVAALRAQSLAIKVEEVAVLQERNRLAREIHDGLASDLAAVVALFKYYEQRRERDPEEAAQLLPQLRSMTEEVLAGARNILQSLRPKTIRSEPLFAAVRKLVDRFGRMHGIETSFSIRGEDAQLTGEQKEGIYQIVREGLSNVRKHAQARHLWVSLDLQASPWVVTVRDDGRGFDPGRLAEDPRKAVSYGLLGMRERASMLEGMLDIISHSGAGTTVILIGPPRE